MIAAIDAAPASIALSSYIFRADRVGNEFIAALGRARAARRRGARADRWLRRRLPAIGELSQAAPGARSGRTLHALGTAMAHAVPEPAHTPQDPVRRRPHCLHRRAEYRRRERRARNPQHVVLDTHFRFEGPVVAQLCEAFAGQWYFTTGESAGRPGLVPGLEPVGDSLVGAIPPARIRTWKRSSCWCWKRSPARARRCRS